MKTADLAIIGAGPAGLAAAIYTSREDIQTIVLERDVISGGLASQTAVIDNYPGFPDGIDGPELGEKLAAQAKRFGAEIITGQTVESIASNAGKPLVSTSSEQYQAKAVLIATGNHYRRLGIPNEQELTGRGVHYCATCDGPLYRDKKLAVVGGGNSAMQEGLFLTKFATHIDLLVRGDKLKGTELLIEQVQKNPKITVHYQTEVTALTGDKMLSGVSVTNKTNDQSSPLEVDGVFVFIGLVPNTDWLQGILKLDPQGFIVTDENFQTSLPGVFAAGDVRAGSTYQIASATGEAVSAALVIRKYLEENPAK